MHYRVETGNAMSPELEKYLQMDDRLASDIARLTLDLKDEERTYQQALGHRKGGSTWREFIVITIIAVLVLNSLAIHMGAQLGWWDTNELVSVLDQRLTALNTYESETVPLVYGAHALGWLGEVILTIFFAFPYQFLTLLAELLSMALPIASPYLPYVEGVILGIIVLIVLKECPLFSGIANGLKSVGNTEATRSKKRIREIKQEIRAKEAERNRLPSDKVLAARQVELEERRQREAEKNRRKEEAARQQWEWEATQRRREEEAARERREAERQRREEASREDAERDALKRRIHDIYWDDSFTPSSTGPDILIMSGDDSHARRLAELLRQFCPDSREVFELSQIKQVEQRMRSGKRLAVYLLASEALSEEQLYRFYMTDVGMRGVILLKVWDYSWVNEEDASPKPVERYDRERRANSYRLDIKRLDIWSLAMLYVAPVLGSHELKEGEPFPFREEIARRFARYRTVAEQNRKGWHIDGDTLVIDGEVWSIDGRAPWADVRDSFSRVELRSSIALASYEREHRVLCHDWKLEGLFEGCTRLVSADLSQMSLRFNYWDEITASFFGCTRLQEVRVPGYQPLIDALIMDGFVLNDDGVFRRSESMDVWGTETKPPRGKHARPAQE